MIIAHHPRTLDLLIQCDHPQNMDPTLTFHDHRKQAQSHDAGVLGLRKVQGGLHGGAQMSSWLTVIMNFHDLHLVPCARCEGPKPILILVSKQPKFGWWYLQLGSCRAVNSAKCLWLWCNGLQSHYQKCSGGCVQSRTLHDWVLVMHYGNLSTFMFFRVYCTSGLLESWSTRDCMVSFVQFLFSSLYNVYTVSLDITNENKNTWAKSSASSLHVLYMLRPMYAMTTTTNLFQSQIE